MESFHYKIKSKLNTENFSISCAIIITIIIIYPILGTSFTFADDLFTATARFQKNGFFNASLDLAKSQGRFYQLYAYTMGQLPYIFNSIEIANLFQIASTLFVFFTFFLMLKELFKNNIISALCTIVTAGLIQTGWSNPFHALPFWFNMGIAFIFFSVYFFNKGFLEQSRKYIWLSAVLYFFSMLYYEVFILYFLIFIILAFIYSTRNFNNLKSLILKLLKLLQPHIVILFVYSAMYFSWRIIIPSQYIGTKPTLAKASDILYTITKLSISGLNWSALKSIKLFLSDINLLTYIAVMIVFCSSFLLLKHVYRILSLKNTIIILVISIIFIFVPNILFGFIERYRSQVSSGIPFYLGSFYSAFPSGISLIMLSFIGLRIAEKIKIRLACLITISLLLSILTFCNIQESRKTFSLHHNTRKYWYIVDKMISSAEKNGLNTSNILIAPSLVKMPTLYTGDYDYWSYYFGNKLGKKIMVVDSKDLTSKHYIDLNKFKGAIVEYSKENSSGFGAIGEIDLNSLKKNKLDLYSNKIDIVTHGKIENMYIEGSIKNCDKNSGFKIMLNDDKKIPCRNGKFNLQLKGSSYIKCYGSLIKINDFKLFKKLIN